LEGCYDARYPLLKRLRQFSVMMRPSQNIICCTANPVRKLVIRPLSHLQKISQRYTWHVTAFRKCKMTESVYPFIFFVNKSLKFPMDDILAE